MERLHRTDTEHRQGWQTLVRAELAGCLCVGVAATSSRTRIKAGGTDSMLSEASPSASDSALKRTARAVRPTGRRSSQGTSNSN